MVIFHNNTTLPEAPSKYLKSTKIKESKLITFLKVFSLFVDTGTFQECGTNVEQDAFIEQNMYVAVDIDNLALDVLYVRPTILVTINQY